MEALKKIPPVNDILLRPELSDLGSILSQPFVSSLLDDVLARTRRRLKAGAEVVEREELAAQIAVDLRRRIDVFLSHSLRRVINASGVVVHTNLGRAPLPQAAIDHLRDVSIGYSNLEFDLEKGTRGRRDVHVARLIDELLGSEAAIVVNNNAAAVLLVLNTLAEGGEALVLGSGSDGGEVIASRGEQIEIGGSFRIPEVMAKSGARLREVGTTNRTRIADYEAAIGTETRLMLRVHPSNFHIVGFTEKPTLEEFVALGRSSGIPTFEDLGSGCLRDLTRSGVRDEPLATESIRAGVDVVCFSGDKLLGGPQAGIIAGRKELIERIRKNQLFRALRVDKLTLSVLEVVLGSYLRGCPDEVPISRMLALDESELKARAEAFAARSDGFAVVASMISVVGGGSAPGAELPSWGVAVKIDGVSEVDIEKRFRDATPPVLVRVEAERVLLDLRTIRPEEEDELLAVLRGVVRRLLV